jgi:5-methylcytosine-specific restriction enzyme subunit McrC
MKKLLLSQNSLGENGRENGFALLFEVQDLFEKYIGVIVKKEFDSNTKLQDTSKKLMIKKSSGNKVIQLKPDIVIEEQKIIVDTKWKILNNQNRNGIQISDLYQMYAYLNRYSDIKKVILMYPLTNDEHINGQSIESYVLEKDENKSIEIVAIDISEKIKTIEGINLILK